ncbi:MAG: hypothetical protein L6Q95_04610, partial [Planctomycetes bacterium]|nr:hypothetical protein [Planctomycetota bacterium]
MKPLHVLAAAAVLLVAGLVVFLRMDTHERAESHRRGAREAPARPSRPGDDARAADAGGSETPATAGEASA